MTRGSKKDIYPTLRPSDEKGEHLPFEKATEKWYPQGTAQAQRKKVKTMFSREAEYTVDFANDKSRISEETGRMCEVGDGWETVRLRNVQS